MKWLKPSEHKTDREQIAVVSALVRKIVSNPAEGSDIDRRSPKRTHPIQIPHARTATGSANPNSRKKISEDPTSGQTIPLPRIDEAYRTTNRQTII
jgi:hypothetical protein